MDNASLERARAAIDKLKSAYLQDWAPATLDELERRLQLARSIPDTVRENLEAAFRLAHDMKGQGATFGFVLISDVGGSLCEMTHERISATDRDICAMLAHVEAARAILNHRLEDPESDMAVAVMANLKSSLTEYLH